MIRMQSSALRARIAQALLRHAPHTADLEPRLQSALAQLISRPGKLVRPQLAVTAAHAHGLPLRRALELGCAIEFFHTASLVLDDLPCMDDATLRRGIPCVHRQHGDATAILTALALINRAYALVHSAFSAQPRALRAQASACLDRALGAAGLVGGQAWDLAFARTERTPRDVSRIAALKTGALFELVVFLPALLARPRRTERRALRALAIYWGQIFQVSDDLRDVLSSTYAEGKTTQRDRVLARPNLALALGLPHARARLARLHRQARRTLAALRASHPRRWRYLEPAASALLDATALPDEPRHAAA